MRSILNTVFLNWEMCLRDVTEQTLIQLPDSISSEPLRCHEVARIVGQLFDLRVVDGNFGGVEHSWLLLRDTFVVGGTTYRTILDPYAVGRLPLVQLCVLPRFTLFGSYHEDVSTYRERFRRRWGEDAEPMQTWTPDEVVVSIGVEFLRSHRDTMTLVRALMLTRPPEILREAAS